jgi:hypothetical protein
MRFILQHPDRHGPRGCLVDAGSITDIARAGAIAGFAHADPDARHLTSSQSSTTRTELP